MLHAGVKRPFAEHNQSPAGISHDITDKSTKAEVEAWLKSFLSEPEANEFVDGVAATGNQLVGKYLLQLNEKVCWARNRTRQ